MELICSLPINNSRKNMNSRDQYPKVDEKWKYWIYKIPNQISRIGWTFSIEQVWGKDPWMKTEKYIHFRLQIFIFNL